MHHLNFSGGEQLAPGLALFSPQFRILADATLRAIAERRIGVKETLATRAVLRTIKHLIHYDT